MVRSTVWVLAVGGVLAAGGVAPSAARGPAIAAPFSTGPDQAGGVPLVLRPVASLGGDTRAVATDGRIVYVGTGNRLVALDARDPQAGHEIGQVAGLCAEELVLGGDQLYATCAGRFRVLDVTDPAHLQVVGQIDRDLGGGPPPSLGRLALGGDFAYVVGHQAAAYDNRLYAVDISDPTQPTVVAVFGTEGASAVAVSEGTLFVTGHLWERIEVFDVSVPSAPRQLPSVDLSGFVSDVAAADGQLCALVYGAPWAAGLAGVVGLHVFDVHDPSHVQAAGFVSADVPRHLALRDGHAYLDEGTKPVGVRVVDVSIPGVPWTEGRFAIGEWVTVTDLAVADAVLHVATVSNSGFVRPTGQMDAPGLRVIDVSRANVPREIGRVSWPGRITVVATAGRYVLAGDDRGLHSIDVLDAARPTSVSQLAVGAVRALAVAGPRAYAVTAKWQTSGSDEGYALRFLDITDAAQPVERRAWAPGWIALDVAAAGPLLFAAAGLDGLRIVDASDLAEPREVAVVKLAGDGVSRVKVDGDTVYLATIHGLAIVDVSAADQPRLVAEIALTGNPYELAVASGTAYLTRWWGDVEAGLFAVDVRDREGPRLVAQVPAGAVGPMTPWGGYLLVPYTYVGGSGFQLVDVTDPAAMANLGVVTWPGQASQIVLDGCRAVVANGSNGLAVGEVQAAVASPGTTPAATWSAGCRPHVVLLPTMSR